MKTLIAWQVFRRKLSRKHSGQMKCSQLLRNEGDNCHKCLSELPEVASVTPRTITTVVRTCLERVEIDLIVPHEQIKELEDKVTRKGYFRTRISTTVLQHFLQELITLSELPPPLEGIAAYSRDPKDDYLVAYGVVNDAAYLISGDSDLLVLHRVGELEIVTPSRFIHLLKGYGFVSL